MENHLALFDFDGTITFEDTFHRFLRHALGLPRLLAGSVIVSPWLVGYLLGVVRNHAAKERVISLFFKGWPAERFQAAATAFGAGPLDTLVRPAARERLAWHRARGHTLYLVSATLEEYLAPWCAAQGMNLLGTRLEVVDGRVTGRLGTPNCFGPEKVRRLRERLDPATFERIYAYGDTRGDKELLELAHEPHFQPFQ
jgi:phosphatidylglycerophosphatase C